MISVVYNDMVYLDPFVTSVTWSGDISQAFRRAEVTIKDTVDGMNSAHDIELGKELRLLDADGMELFRGVIFVTDADEAGNVTATAYDELYYLTVNDDTKKFASQTAASTVREICADFGIPTGTIADTGYVLPKLVLRNRSLWDMVTTALTETRKATGRRFWIYAKGGRLNLAERGVMSTDWMIERGVNLSTASYSKSIENMRTQVKVISSETEKQASLTAVAKDDALITAYGLMQHLETEDSDKTQAELDEKARQLLADLAKIKDEARLEALGNVKVTAGTAVYVRAPLSGIVGGFYVITDSHTFSNGVHRMNLTVSADESLPKLYYDPPASDDPNSSKGKKSAETAAEMAALSRL